jgi:hypothetical protein
MGEKNNSRQSQRNSDSSTESISTSNSSLSTTSVSLPVVSNNVGSANNKEDLASLVGVSTPQGIICYSLCFLVIFRNR